MAVKKKANGETDTVQLRVDFTPDTPNYYVNHIEISHTKHDFCMAVARLPTKLPPDRLKEVAASRVLAVEPTLTLTVPPTLMRGLIRALEIQVAAYEGKFGQIRQEDENAPSAKRVRH